MSDHSFNPFIAQAYSVNIAIFLNNMVFWTRTNAATNNNFCDGRYWTYGTPDFYAKYFPYFKPRLIKDIIQSCIDHGLILKGNYNKKGYDRTNWYALSDKALNELRLDITCLQPTPGLIVRNPSNPLDEKRPMDRTDYVRPIPDTKPYKEKDNISASGESPNNRYTESDEERKKIAKSDYTENQAESEGKNTQAIEPEEDPTRSDYFEYQTKNESVSKSSIPYGLKNIQEENIFSIPEEVILDWIANRKKKRLPITATAWKKINKELARCKQHGLDPVEAFETFVANGWQSFKLEWLIQDKEKSKIDSKSSSPAKDYW